MSTPEVLYNQNAILSDYIYNRMGRVIGLTTNQQVRASQVLPTLGNFQSFMIPRQGLQMVTSVNLISSISAMSKTGGTYIRGTQGFGIQQYDHLELWCAGVKLSNITAEQMYTNYLENNGYDYINAMNAAVGIASTAARATAAAAAQTFSVELDECFSLFAQPLPIHLLNADLELRVYYKQSISYLVETDGTAPSFSYSDVYLDVEYTQIPDAVAKFIAERVAKDEFILFGYDWINVQNTIAAGTGATQFQFAMQQLVNLNVIKMDIIARLSSDLTTALAVNYVNYQSIASYNLKSASNFICGTLFDITDSYYRQALLLKYNPVGINNLYNANIYMISYTDELDQVYGEFNNNYAGSRPFYGVTDATLTLNFASSPAAALTINTLVSFVQRYKIDKRGAIVPLP